MKVINVHCGKIWKRIETYKEENKESRTSPFRALYLLTFWYVTVLSFFISPNLGPVLRFCFGNLVHLFWKLYALGRLMSLKLVFLF